MGIYSKIFAPAAGKKKTDPNRFFLGGPETYQSPGSPPGPPGPPDLFQNRLHSERFGVYGEYYTLAPTHIATRLDLRVVWVFQLGTGMRPGKEPGSMVNIRGCLCLARHTRF